MNPEPHRAPPLLLAAAALACGLAAQRPLQTVEGTADGDSLGVSVQPAGDVDKDGRDDFVVGAPGDDGNGRDSGSAFVYSGADGRLIYLFRGAAARDEFGYAVAGAGDVDADGYADVIIGAPYEDNRDGEHPQPKAGSAQVFSGRDGRLVHTFRGPSDGDALGWSVAGLGDVDGDGHGDLAVGAPFYDRKGAPDVGLVVVYSGKTGKVLHELRGKSAGDRFGWSLCGIAGDRAPDLLVGIEGSSHKLKQAGSAQLFAGRRGSPRRTLRTGQEQDYFGTAVASAGDVDGDGRDDLLIGAWNGRNGNGERTGIAQVVSGRSGALLLQVAGTSEYDRFGAAVAGIGDVDGDGRPDIAVGAPQQAEQGSGYVRVFSGRSGAILFTLVGEAIGDGFGTAVCAVPDRNDDGRPDLVVGAPGLRKRGGWQLFASPSH